MVPTVNFAYNPTSWANGAPIPGGMADCLVRPILPHLRAPHVLTACPTPGTVNVYYTHRRTYGMTEAEPGLVSIFVSHGIADKGWRDRGRVRVFDHIFVSGPAWTEKMAKQGFPRARIHEVGYAKLDPLFLGEVEGKPKDERIRVVWAPTHGGGGERAAFTPRLGSSSSSWWRGAGHVLPLLDPERFDVVVAPHPRHREDKRATLSEYVGADVVIADGGSTIYEAWSLGIPVVFPTWLTGATIVRKRAGTMEEAIYTAGLGVHVVSPPRLPGAVERAAAEGLPPEVVSFVEEVLPMEYRGQSGRLHAEAIDRITEDV